MKYTETFQATGGMVRLALRPGGVVWVDDGTATKQYVTRSMVRLGRHWDPYSEDWLAITGKAMHMLAEAGY